MKVVIMRGIPGSGKSTWIKQNYPKAIKWSADDYFIDDHTKEYNFVPEELGDAHKNCMLHFVHSVTTKSEFQEDTVIIVDNTNISLHDVTPYLRIAQAYDWDVEVVRMECNPEVAFKRNKHEVPLGTVKRMHKNLKPLPKYIGTEIVVQTDLERK